MESSGVAVSPRGCSVRGECTSPSRIPRRRCPSAGNNSSPKAHSAAIYGQRAVFAAGNNRSQPADTGRTKATRSYPASVGAGGSWARSQSYSHPPTEKMCWRRLNRTGPLENRGAGPGKRAEAPHRCHLITCDASPSYHGPGSIPLVALSGTLCTVTSLVRGNGTRATP